MGIEYEVRKLDIDLLTMIGIVEKIGAECVGVFHQKRYVYDLIPPEKGRWIRLRTNGIFTTLTFKEITSDGIDGTKEEEIVVSDFEGTNRILKKLGFIPRSFQENFRIKYRFGEVVLDIDKWPMINPHIEIEGNSKESIFKILNTIGIDSNEVTTMDINNIYQKVYSINLDDIPHLALSNDELSEIETLLETYYPHLKNN